MTTDELKDQLALAGIPARIRRDEVLLETCPVCGNAKWNVELNPSTGIWGCWAHGKGGRLDSLLSMLIGGSHHIPVHSRGGLRDRRLGAAPPSPPPEEFAKRSASEVLSAATYLSRRGLGPEEVKAYGLTVCVEPKHRLEGRIVIPAYDYWTGRLVAYVGRSYTGQRPKYITTAQVRVITGYRVRQHGTPTVIVEGQFDGIATHRAGFNTAILSGITSEAVEEFAARVEPESRLVLMLDGEAREEARKLTARIGAVRPVATVYLPDGVDPGSLHPLVVRAVIERA